MKINKKVALVSVKNRNYGSLLQTYAIQNYLFSIGIENELILFIEKNIFRNIWRLRRFSFFRNKFKVVYRNIYLKLFKKKLYNNLKIRNSKFDEFKNTQLIFSKPFIDRNVLKRSTKNYTAFVLGSDQVWHPDNMGMDFYNLYFIPQEIPKIAYAPSFGITKIPFDQLGKTKRYLSRINHISVREESGKDIVKKLIDRDVQVVCDPTLLVDRVVWDRLKGQTQIVNEKYIFCYFLGNNPLHREFARQVKKETGYKLVTLLHLCEYIKSDDCFGDITPFDIGPAEFINLISNAEIVLTDSFHCTIFSVMYNRLFFTFSRYIEHSSLSANSRIKSILNILGVTERLIKGDEKFDTMRNLTIDYDKLHQRLNSFRDASRSYLTKSFKTIQAIQSIKTFD